MSAAHQMMVSLPMEAGGYSFTITAADYLAAGYGFVAPDTGTLDSAEPLDAPHTLYVCATLPLYGGFLVYFVGDCATLLSGLSVWVDGVDYGTGDSGWNFADGYTTWSRATGGPTFAATQYFVQIK